MNEDYKITVDWAKLSETYANAGIDISELVMPSDESLLVKCDHSYDSICSASATCSDSAKTWEYKSNVEIRELKQKLEEAEHANEIMRTDSKAMAEGLVRRDDKIKALEAEVAELKAMIEYCKKNGVWAEIPLLKKIFPELI